ncbi:hypothetical protein BDQ17DRAFT_1342270 [Cyathus striatus]|nr:hypothetical protein BDQ17DRAFT_1342270 [Cyathus striatus]
MAERVIIKEFLEQYVTSDITLPITDATFEQKLVTLANAIPCPGRLDIKTYELIVALCNESQEGFNLNKKVVFGDTHSQIIPGLTSYHDIEPDILGTYPGRRSLPSKEAWSQYCIAVKVNAGQDTNDLSAKEFRRFSRDEKGIARLLEDVRNLLSS